MKRTKFTLVLSIFLVLSFTSCEKDDKGKIINENAETLIHDGIEREYILHISDSYTGDSAVPLLFNFHGFGGTATEHMQWADMRELANAENFILVYPQGAFLDGFSHWNAGLNSPTNKSSVDDFGFFIAMINEIASSYNIDTERIYTCGYSNGAFFSYALACYHSDKIAAVGSVSGTMMQETYDNCSPTHPMPMINLHGSADNTVLYNGGDGLQAISDVIDYWIDFNQTDEVAIVNTIGNIEHYAYYNGSNSVAVEHYLIQEGSHVWFDIDYNGANTNELIWDFVSQYDINGLR